MEMKFREISLASGAIVLLGKDAKNNDELMKNFKGKSNIIMHTVSPGSPFCVIDNLKPSRKDMSASGAICAKYSQDWRDNKGDVKVNIFTGKDISKRKGMKPGTWKVGKCKVVKVKKGKIEKIAAKFK